MMTFSDSEVSTNRSANPPNSDRSSILLACTSNRGLSSSIVSSPESSDSDSSGGGSGFLNCEIGGKSKVIATALGNPPCTPLLHSSSHCDPSKY